VRDHGPDVFAHIDHGENARQVGLTMNPAYVLIFGNARAGTPLIVAAPLVALDLPLRVLIWQNGDGNVRVSYASPESLIRRYGLPDAFVANIAGIAGLIGAATRPDT
jgi:uncharacterized protein (DUF302 family)